MLNQTQIIEQFIRLASIVSPTGKEKNIRDYLQKELQALGFETKVDTIGNLIAKKDGTGEPILLSGHMDTVSIGKGECINPIVNTEKGVIHTDGSTILGADNKDNLTAILEALRYMSEQGWPQRPIEILFTAGEEGISIGAKACDLSQFASKQCIISDSQEPYGSITLSAPHCATFDVEVYGKRAHARVADTGVSAILLASHAITQLYNTNIPGATILISHCAGGLEEDVCSRSIHETDRQSMNRNTVPDRMHVYGEVRSTYKGSMDELLATVEHPFEHVCHELGGGFTFTANPLAHGYMHDPSTALIQSIESIFQSQDITPRHHHSLGGSDANILNQQGLETIEIGSAHRHSHKVEEYLIIEDLMKLTEFFVEVIKK